MAFEDTKWFIAFVLLPAFVAIVVDFLYQHTNAIWVKSHTTSYNINRLLTKQRMTYNEYRSSYEPQLGNLTMISAKPLVYYHEQFLTEEECDHLMHLAKEENLKPSKIIKSSNKSNNVKISVASVRTSDSTFLMEEKDITLQKILRRIDKLMRMSGSRREPIEVCFLNSIPKSYTLITFICMTN